MWDSFIARGAIQKDHSHTVFAESSNFLLHPGIPCMVNRREDATAIQCLGPFVNRDLAHAHPNSIDDRREPNRSKFCLSLRSFFGNEGNKGGCQDSGPFALGFHKIETVSQQLMKMHGKCPKL